MDLFVRVSNLPAIRMYEKLGYTVYRRILEYYTHEMNGEDAFGANLMTSRRGIFIMDN